MNNNLFVGKLTRLVAADPDRFGEWYATWSRDSEFLRFFDSDPAVPRNVKKTQEAERADSESQAPGSLAFLIHTLEQDKLIGLTAVWRALTPQGDPWVAIGIGDREYWGKGYGSDALGLVLGYGFLELNAHRVSLVTFENNPRAIRSYEKLGFAHEGRQRGALKRDSVRIDMLFMGILRRDWEHRRGTGQGEAS
jgi:RimJ/RimL family protein N-acetyltransferase